MLWKAALAVALFSIYSNKARFFRLLRRFLLFLSKTCFFSRFLLQFLSYRKMALFVGIQSSEYSSSEQIVFEYSRAFLLRFDFLSPYWLNSAKELTGQQFFSTPEMAMFFHGAVKFVLQVLLMYKFYLTSQKGKCPFR